MRFLAIEPFLALLLSTSISEAAESQDRSILMKHCVSITDIDERIECLETGSLRDPGRFPAPSQTQRRRLSPAIGCRTARTRAGRAVCGDDVVSEWDARLGQAFQQAARRRKESVLFFEDRRLWLAERDKRCGALSEIRFALCLREMTKQRVVELSRDVAGTPQTVSSASVPSTVPDSNSTAIPTAPVEPPVATRQSAPASAASPEGGARTTATETETSAIGSLLAIVGLGVLITALRFPRKTRRKQQPAAALTLLEERRRLEWRRLVGKHGRETATRIAARTVWQGMTVEQLLESWGRPVDIDREIFKARSKETWKYVQTGKNRFANRVYLENGIVIGWKV